MPAPYVGTNWKDYPDLTTAITAARLNNIEAGILAAYIEGSGTLVNADMAPGAAIAYSKLNLALSILNGDISASAAIDLAKLADPGTGKVIGSSAGVATAVVPPSTELGYTQYTSSVTIASTTEATGTLVATSAAITFDGAPVLCEFFCPAVLFGSVVTTIIIALFEGATEIGRLGRVTNEGTAIRIPVSLRYRFSPTAGPHTYKITVSAASLTGSPTLEAATPGTGSSVPGFLKFVKV